MTDKIKMNKMDGVDSSFGVVGYDAEKWREHPDPENYDSDDDVKRPTPSDVVEALGFDPDKEGWDEE